MSLAKKIKVLTYCWKWVIILRILLWFTSENDQVTIDYTIEKSDELENLLNKLDEHSQIR